jgi:hypothetical protein
LVSFATDQRFSRRQHLLRCLNDVAAQDN